MKRMVGMLAILCLLGCATMGRTQSNDFPQYTIEQFLETTNYTGGSFSSDNRKVLISSDESGVFNAYSVNVADEVMTKLTNSAEDSIYVISYFPEDERFLFTADQGGNELNHVYVQLEDGSSRDLTPGENLKAQFAGWAHDKKSFYVQTNERDPRFFDVYEYQIDDTFSREMIFKNEDGFSPSTFSRDNKWVALAKKSHARRQ